MHHLLRNVPKEEPISIFYLIEKYLSDSDQELDADQRKILESSRFLKNPITQKTRMDNVCSGYTRLINLKIRPNQGIFHNIDLEKTKIIVGFSVLLKINPHFTEIFKQFNKLYTPPNYNKFCNFVLKNRRTTRQKQYKISQKMTIDERHASTIKTFLRGNSNIWEYWNEITEFILEKK